jgi:hypothetical protein
MGGKKKIEGNESENIWFIGDVLFQCLPYICGSSLPDIRGIYVYLRLIFAAARSVMPDLGQPGVTCVQDHLEIVM